jgi:lysozyme
VTHSPACVLFTAQFEGLKTIAYQDGNGVWTLGYGRAEGVKPGDTCTLAQAQQWLSEDLDVADMALARLIKVTIEQNQWDALCDLCFNIGQGNFEESTCLKLLNQGDEAGAINSICYFDNDEWHGWVMVAGKASPGLVHRRQAEQALFSKSEES